MYTPPLALTDMIHLEEKLHEVQTKNPGSDALLEQDDLFSLYSMELYMNSLTKAGWKPLQISN